MSSFDGLALVVGVAVPCAVAAVGWLGSEDAAAGQPDRRRSRRRRAAAALLVVAASVVMTIASPVTAVFWAIVALNFVAGRRENVPFSRYPMFSDPSTSAWSLRFENEDGEAVKIGRIGLAPHIMRKRFATEMRAARTKGIHDPGEVRRTAAEVLAGLVEQHRPPGGPMAACPIRIVLVEYLLESGRLRKVRTPILETSPQ